MKFIGVKPRSRSWKSSANSEVSLERTSSPWRVRAAVKTVISAMAAARLMVPDWPLKFGDDFM